MQLFVVLFIVLTFKLPYNNKYLATAKGLKKGIECYECDGPSSLCSCKK